MPGTVVVLTTHNVAYRLSDLLASLTQAAHPFPGLTNCRELTLTGDPGNAAGIVYIGDGKVSTSDYELQLPAAASYTWRDDRNSVSFTNKFLLGSVDGIKADVLFETQ